jgi:hypothetical protein
MQMGKELAAQLLRTGLARSICSRRRRQAGAGVKIDRRAGKLERLSSVISRQWLLPVR